tara:strand:+ start:42 stop:329 length:288 start_codon:yes stop_codon:yes gene_type:complete
MEYTAEQKEQYPQLKRQEEFDDNQTCQVSGTGKYRFNQYGRNGFAWRQTRFKNKDKAIEWLCIQRPYSVVRVMPDNPQYEVMVWDGKTRTRRLKR